MQKQISIFFTLIFTLGMSASLNLALPQSSQRPPRAPGRELTEQGEMTSGKVSSVGIDRIEIKKQDGTSQLVMVNDQTHYRQGQQDIQLEDLKPGDQVFVRGKTNDNKEFIANIVRRVTDEEIQRFQGDGERTGGQILSIEGNQLKVQNPRQGEKVVIVNAQTTFMKSGQAITLKDLKVGDRIFVLGKESDGKFIATQVMTGPFQRGGGRGGRMRDSEQETQ